jgi:curli biogenesis system outer membrane secretion channel CsgG
MRMLAVLAASLLVAAAALAQSPAESLDGAYAKLKQLKSVRTKSSRPRCRIG